MSNRANFFVVSLFATIFLSSPCLGQLTSLTQGANDSLAPSADLKGRYVALVNNGTLFLADLRKNITGLIVGDVLEARVSGTGKFVIFASDGDPLGTNEELNQEIFVFVRKSGGLLQATFTDAGITSCCASIDKKGRFGVYLSNHDQLGGNADGNDELFMFDAKKVTLTQISVTGAGVTNANPIVSHNGKYVFMDSDGDLAGSNADGNREIFRYVIKTGVWEQLTDTTTGDSERPLPDKGGKRIVFETDSTDILTTNADGEKEIVRLDVKKDELLRVTDFAFASTNASISGNARLVTFESAGDPLGTNADGSTEIFLLDTKEDDLTQISSGAGGTESVSACLDKGGKNVFFLSDADLTGGGSGTDHVFQFAR